MTVKEKIIASLGAFAVKVRHAETNEQVLKLVDRTALELGKVLVKDQNHDPTTN